MSPRFWVLLQKEFREYRRNKLIVATMAGLPVMFLLVTLVPLLTIPSQVPEQAARALGGQALLLFLLIPVILPTTIAAYSVIGEREQGTLEPLLTTPATDGEILLAKATAATVPGVALTWVLFGVFAALLAGLARPAIREGVLTAQTLVAVGALAPVLGILAIELSMIVSSRSSDIRVAQQLSALSVLPAVVVTSLFTYGVFRASVGRYLLIAGVFGMVDALGWRIVTGVFDRDRVLTRYGG
jgi:ABC-type transport system involved in multi-copper enzyme maturation permease subunit